MTATPNPPPASGPDLDAHLDGLLRKLDYASAQVAQEYDLDRQALADHHAELDRQVPELLKRAEELAPAVEAFLHGDQSKLDQETAEQCLAYLEVCAALGQALQGRRVAFGAALPPGELSPGSAIGDPASPTPDAE